MYGLELGRSVGTSPSRGHARCCVDRTLVPREVARVGMFWDERCSSVVLCPRQISSSATSPGVEISRRSEVEVKRWRRRCMNDEIGLGSHGHQSVTERA